MFASSQRAPASAKAVTLSELEAESAHPAIPKTTKSLVATFKRVLIVGVIVVGAAMLAACGTIQEHRDGGGYTVRYMQSAFATSPRPSFAAVDAYGDPVYRRDYYRDRYAYDYPRPRRVVHTPPPRPSVVVVAAPKPSILNIGRDDEIPVEHASKVSDRHIRSLAARNKMCSESRAGYCSRPNYAHCHGTFCHAHPGGNRKHTHSENDRNNDHRSDDD
jgi:hypothetical protein